VRVDAVNHLAVHLNQAAVGVVGKPCAAGGGRKSSNRLVVQPEIEDRVHHPRHRNRRAGPDRDEERVRRVAERRARDALEAFDVLGDLVLEAGGKVSTARQERAAGIRRDREARWDGHTEVCHLGEPEALATE
jgi:hypothetical protein